jgi:NAD(P)-dependent dehydrogenase (short-subunit alcohol dehydrogenase family)
VTRILITGSAQGLGRAAATTLLDEGHQVVVHARDTSRAAALTDLVDRGAAVVIGDLASAQQTRHLAEQVNQLGRMDAVIHNAGVYGDRDRNPGPEGHPRLLAVNTLAPYLLTGLIERPDRLIYLTSDMHVSGDDSLHDLDWTTRRWNGTQAYCDSKLFVTPLALAVAPRWPNTSATRSIPAGYPPEWAAPPPATSSNKATSPKLGSPSAAVPTPPAAAKSGTTTDQPPSPQLAIAASKTDSSSRWPR